ncbi:MAG TPA: GNAT family N-acetyltransferase [Casimicrobiaceae bacterium]|jgi:GNAT superfamily N-acetyltransferase
MTTPSVRMLGPDDLALFDDDSTCFVDGVDARVAASLLDDPSRHVAIAVDGGRVVGVAFAMQREDRDRELVVADVAVAPSHRRRGVGRRLLAVLLERGRALGCHEASVEAGHDDAALRALCAAAGGIEETPTRVRVAFALR